MTTCTSNLPAARVRTAPLLKYLLNERAAAVGALAGQTRLATELRAKAHELETKLNSLRTALEQVEAERCGRTAELDALETVLSSMGASELAVPAVKAWAGNYGKRGARAAFVKGLIQDAGDSGISLGDIVRAVSAHFGLVLHTLRDRENLRTSIRDQLRTWRTAGLIQSRQGPKNTVLWTWNRGPNAEDLYRLAGDDEPVTHTLGCEVGRERASGSHG